MKQTLNADLSKAILGVLREHPGVNHNDVVGCLLANAASYGSVTIGNDKTIIQLAIQIAQLSGGNVEEVGKIFDTLRAAIETRKFNPTYGMV